MYEDLLSETSAHTIQFLELCNALYERELRVLARGQGSKTEQIQNRLKSLPYYVKRTSDKMLRAKSPLLLDLQNASWSMKQQRTLPIKEQNNLDIQQWYDQNPVVLGLVVPVLIKSNQVNRIMLDCVDLIDAKTSRFRTNYCGWFSYQQQKMHKKDDFLLLKPNKKVFSAACCGHQWQAGSRTMPLPLSLRELLLSSEINWHNYQRLNS